MNRAAAPPKGPKHYSTGYLVKRLVRSYLRPYFRPLALSLVLMAFASAMTASIAMLMQPILDDVLYGQEKNLILPVAGAICLTFVLRGLASYAHTLITVKIGQSIIADVQKALFDQFLGLDLSFFHANPSGQLISRVINDVNIMRSAVNESLTGIGKSGLTLIFLIGVMFYQDWQLSLAAFTIFPIMALFVAKIGQKLRQISKTVQQEQAGLTYLLSQIFQGVRQVQAYGMEEYEKNKTHKAIEKVKKLNIKSARTGNLSTPVNEILIGFIAAGVIAYGGYQSAAGEMTPGQLMAFLSAFIMAYEPMKKLSRLNNTLQTGLGASERVFAMLDTQAQIQDEDNANVLSVLEPEIEFHNVSFEYQENSSQEMSFIEESASKESYNKKALENVSFVAKPGSVTALVGPSGGGKSTIINLIPRFYDVSNGHVLIGGHKLRDITLESLRSHIALVSQDITIFDDTIAANIAYGSPGSSIKKIKEAAQSAAAHEFIESFPEGYETQVGEDGVKLSGGQRQRIAIARAILRDAPILLLDEATSALDNESEKVVQDALARLEKGRTTLVIAHRLSTVQNADQIIVLDQGNIVQNGTHEKLLKEDGLYAHLYSLGLQE